MPIFGTVPEITRVSHQRSSSLSDDVDFEIKGSEMQYVEIELDPGESAIAEAGSMMHKDSEIEMDSIFGDGSESSGGFLDAITGAGMRILTGESLFSTQFTHQGAGKARVAFAAPYPGQILAIKTRQCWRQTHLPKRFLSLCRARRVHRHFFSTAHSDRIVWR